ncbi:hypothetical protein MNBD_ALPHA03-829, partial [hydrothermal vent metagenome]
MRQIFVDIFSVFSGDLKKILSDVSEKFLICLLIFSFVLLFGLSSYGQSASLLREIKKDFDIEAQSLSIALLDFGAQANMSLLVRKKDTDEKTSKALKGQMYPKEALIILLDGTQLGFKYINKKTISISPALFQEPNSVISSPLPHDHERGDVLVEEDYISPIDEVVVTSLRRRSNMQKVPVAVTVIKPPFIRETRIHDIEDVGTRVPGLTVSSFSIGQPTIHMRG